MIDLQRSSSIKRGSPPARDRENTAVTVSVATAKESANEIEETEGN
jgi:hypothetical protein